MPDTILFRGLPGDGLDIFLRNYREAAAEDPFAAWLILPTKRLVTKTVRELAGEPGSTVLSSRICTLQEFCTEYFLANRTTTRLLGRAESRLLLQQILLANKKDLLLFFTRGNPSSATLESLQEFMQVVIRRKIGYPSCLGDLQSEKSRQIGMVLTAYQKMLKDRDLVDPDTVFAWTRDHLVSNNVRPKKVFVYGIYSPLPLEEELLSLLKNEAREFVVFLPTGSDEKVFRGGNEWIGTPRRTEVVPVLDPGKAGVAGIFSEHPGTLDGSGIRCATFATQSREISRVAEEICRLHDRGIPFSDIAVGFPDVRENLGLVQDVFSDFAIPWSSATGMRLNRLPLVQEFLAVPGAVSQEFSRDAVLRVVQGPRYQSARSGAGGCRVPDLDVRELDLVSRFAPVEKWETGWERGFAYLEKRLSELELRGDPLPVQKEALARVKTGTAALFRALAPLQGTHGVREFVRNYRDLLGRWGFFTLLPAPDKKIMSAEYGAQEKFLACLDRIENLADTLAPGPVTCGEFLRILSTLAGEIDFLPEDPGTGVQVIGLREAANDRFPYLFLAGLTEGNLPRLTTRIPFTSQLENARMGTRSLDDVLREARYYFIAALLAGKQAVYLSAAQSDGENPLLSSAFFERVRALQAEGPWADTESEEIRHSKRADAVRAGNALAARDVPAALPHLSSGLVPRDIAKRATVEEYERDGTRTSPYAGYLADDPAIRAYLFDKFGPAHTYSPTVLETYAACPLCFFIEKVLEVEALPEIELNLSARDRGTAVHNILSAFYRAWKGAGRGRVHLSELAEAGELMSGIVTAELGRYTFMSPAWEATCIQMTGSPATGPGIFTRFLHKEANEEDSPLVPSYFEFTFGMRRDENDDPASVPDPVAIIPVGGTEPVRIKGRVDRIDITPDGRFAIYDYKTGSQIATRNEIASGKALQIPLYLLAYEQISHKQGVLGGYYRIRREVEDRIVLLDDAGRDLVVSSNPRATKDFRAALLASLKYSAEYIRGIRAGEFMLPAEEKCQNPYCEFSTICRFDPSRLFSSTEGT